MFASLLLNELFGLGTEVTATDHNREGTPLGLWQGQALGTLQEVGQALRLVPLLDVRHLPCSQQRFAKIEYALRRYIDDAHMGMSVHHQGYVHRKFTVPFDKLLRSVQRIHQPEGIPLAALGIVAMQSLLAQDGQIGGLQNVYNATMGCLVGQRQRRVICLTLNAEVLAGVGIYRHDVAPRSQRCTYGHAQCRFQIILFHICLFCCKGNKFETIIRI